MFVPLIVGAVMYLTMTVPKRLIIGGVTISVLSLKREKDRLQRQHRVGINPFDEINKAKRNPFKKDPEPVFVEVVVDMEGLPPVYHTLNGKWLLTPEEASLLSGEIGRLEGFLKDETEAPSIDLFTFKRRSDERYNDPEIKKLVKKMEK